MPHHSVVFLSFLAIIATSGVASVPLPISNADGDASVKDGAVVVEALQHVDAEFNKWASKHGRSYNSPQGRAAALANYARNALAIAAHNGNPDATFTMALNQFADMSESEFEETILMKRISRPARPVEVGHEEDPATTPPAAVDWRDHGLVTPVKDQGYCGSCWAFSATAALEGAHAKASGKLISLSEQEIVSCSHFEENSGCDGGDPRSAMHDVRTWGGQQLETQYPYKHDTATHTPKCIANVTTYTAAAIDHQIAFKMGDVDGLERAVANHGPLSVCINVKTPFAYYAGGVFQAHGCKQDWDDLNHCVTLVGYNNTASPNYWIIKNSYGPSWGEKGFMRMLKTKGVDTCGLAMEATVPVSPVS